MEHKRIMNRQISINPTKSNPIKSNPISIRQITLIALMSAITCIIAPNAIFIGQVPISLTNFVIFFSVYILGMWGGTVSCCIYLLLGIIGLPVFSGYSGGLGKIAGPTGGYLLGFIFMALIGGAFIEIFKRKFLFTIIGWIIGAAVADAFGTLWFVILMKCSVTYALTVCVYPFIIFDLVKIVAATIVARQVYAALMKAGIL